MNKKILSILICVLMFTVCLFGFGGCSNGGGDGGAQGGVFTRDGDYIYFGLYPQTVKAESVTVSDTANKDGYYEGNDGELYAKVVAYPCDFYYPIECTFSDNTVVRLGNTYYFKLETIKWRILSEKDGVALILCDSIIYNKVYDADSNNYKNSDIRAWLNDDFINTAFSADERAIINTVTVDNSTKSMQEPSIYACANTQDKVFLLSDKEAASAEYGFDATGVKRMLKTSDYSRATGVYTYIGSDQTYYGVGIWYLRTPSNYTSTDVRIVSESGYISVREIYSTSGGIVPAMQINLK